MKKLGLQFSRDDWMTAFSEYAAKHGVPEVNGEWRFRDRQVEAAVLAYIESRQLVPVKDGQMLQVTFQPVGATFQVVVFRLPAPKVLS